MKQKLRQEHTGDTWLLRQWGSGRDMEQDDLTQDKGRHRLKIQEVMETGGHKRGGADNQTEVETLGQEVKSLK